MTFWWHRESLCTARLLIAVEVECAPRVQFQRCSQRTRCILETPVSRDVNMLVLYVRWARGRGFATWRRGVRCRGWYSHATHAVSTDARPQETINLSLEEQPHSLLRHHSCPVSHTPHGHHSGPCRCRWCWTVRRAVRCSLVPASLPATTREFSGVLGLSSCHFPRRISIPRRGQGPARGEWQSGCRAQQS